MVAVAKSRGNGDFDLSVTVVVVPEVSQHSGALSARFR